jgi:hypothetical protein
MTERIERNPADFWRGFAAIGLMVLMAATPVVILIWDITP